MTNLNLDKNQNHDDTTNGITGSTIRYTWKKQAGSKFNQKCSCDRESIKAYLYSFLPLLAWIQDYKWKTDFISDLVAGITVGIMSIPQGMSYAGVVGVPAVYGLYSNIIPTITYVLFGSSRIAAIGPPAVVSITLGNTRHKFIPDPNTDISPGCISLLRNGSSLEHLDTVSINNPACFTSWQLIISLTMLTGFILIIMGILRFGYLSNYLSDHLIGGFTSGAAIHAMTSQLGYIFGIHLSWRSGVGKIVLHINEAVIASVCISTICILSLLIMKIFLNTKFQRAFGVPIPGELLIVFLGTGVSYVGQFEERFHVTTVHQIPSGFPQPLLPRFDLMRLIAIDAVILALILYSLSISLAKLYAKRNDYQIDPHQEFFAFGLINVIGSFFQCFASGQIVSRSIVYESAGAKSQFAGAFGSILVIVTVLWVAPLLASLPKCILGSIIWVACIQMLKQMRQLKVLFSNSKYDFMIYLFTFLFVVLLDVKEGLLASVIFTIIMGIIRTIRIKLCKNRLSDNIYDEVMKSQKSKNDKIFKFDEPLYFANIDRFQRQVYEICGLTKDDLCQDASNMELNSLQPANLISTISSTTRDDQIQARQLLNENDDNYVIIDCHAFDYIDSMGVRALRQIDTYLMKRAITPYYVKCSGDNLKKLITAQFLDEVRRPRFHPTVDIALSIIRSRNRPIHYGTNGEHSEHVIDGY